MELTLPKLNLETNLTTEGQAFSIQAGAKAFEILSSGIYSDKIKAVIRELSTNAWDAHIEAGTTDRPFDVHLPTAINSVYWLRDYGTGLPEHQCLTLYSTYFASTKDKSNDVNGMLGLGSKAPLSYADTTTVESFYNGTHYVFSVYISPEGPRIVKLHEEATDEPNGMKISVAVEDGDRHTFRDKAESVYQAFKVKPNMIGHPKFFDDDPEVVTSGNGWTLYDNYMYDGPILMANVLYPLNNREITGLKYGSRVVYEIPTGELDIATSREELGYTNKTKASLNKYIKDANQEIAEWVESELASCDSWFDAMVMKSKYVPLVRDIFNFRSLEYDGRSLGGSFNIGNDNAEKMASYQHRSSKIYLNKKKTNYVDIEESALYVCNDDDSQIRPKIRKYIEDNNLTGYIDIYVWSGTVQELQTILGLKDDSRIIRMSKLEKPKRAKSTRSGQKVCNAYKIDLDNRTIDRASLDATKPFVYFECSRDQLKLPSSSWSAKTLVSCLGIYHKFEPIDLPIYLITPSVMKNKQIDNNKNGQNGYEFVRKYLQTIADKYLMGDWRYLEEPNLDYSYAYDYVSDHSQNQLVLDFKSEYRQCLENYRQILKNNTQKLIFYNVDYFLGKFGFTELSFDWTAQFEKSVTPLYPYVTFLDGDDIAGYIKDMDELNQYRSQNK